MYASLARTLAHYRTYNGRYDPADIHPLTPYPAPPADPVRSVADKRLTDKPFLSAASIRFAFEAMSALNRPEEEADWQQFGSMKQVAWKSRERAMAGGTPGRSGQPRAIRSAYGWATLREKAGRD